MWHCSSEFHVTFSLDPGFANPTQQAVVYTEEFLVPIPLLDSLNSLWHFPVSDSDPGAPTGKEKKWPRRYCWATSKSVQMQSNNLRPRTELDWGVDNSIYSWALIYMGCLDLIWIKGSFSLSVPLNRVTILIWSIPACSSSTMDSTSWPWSFQPSQKQVTRHMWDSKSALHILFSWRIS